MEILYVKPAVWNPTTREWIIDIGIKDIIDGKNTKYVQRITCETLVSAERITKEIREKQR